MIFIYFDLLWFHSNLQRICFIELSSERDSPILDRFKRKLDIVFFPLGLWNFWWGAWFTFNEGHFTIYYTTQNFFTILTVWTKIVMGFLPHQLSKLSKHEKIVFVRSWCLQVKSCILLYQIFQIYEIIFSFFAIVKEHPKNRFGKSLKIRFYITW